MAVVRLWGFILNAMGRTEDAQSRRVTCCDLHLVKSILPAMWTVTWKAMSVVVETD